MCLSSEGALSTRFVFWHTAEVSSRVVRDPAGVYSGQPLPRFSLFLQKLPCFFSCLFVLDVHRWAQVASRRFWGCVTWSTISSSKYSWLGSVADLVSLVWPFPHRSVLVDTNLNIWSPVSSRLLSSSRVWIQMWSAVFQDCWQEKKCVFPVPEYNWSRVENMTPNHCSDQSSCAYLITILCTAWLGMHTFNYCFFFHLFFQCAYTNLAFRFFQFLFFLFFFFKWSLLLFWMLCFYSEFRWLKQVISLNVLNY